MLELLKEYVRINRALPAEPVRSVYEFDCIVPDALPDVVRVLALDGAAVAEEVTAGSGTLTVRFRIFYKILYMTDSAEALVKSFKAVSEHTCVFDVPDLTAECGASAVCSAENTDFTLVNSRKMALRTAVRVEPRISRPEECAVTTGITGLEGLQVKTKHCTFTSAADTVSSTMVLEEHTELPAGKDSFLEILRADPRICDMSVQLTGDKLQIRGNLSVCTLYVADDRDQSLQIMENQFPFTHIVPVNIVNDAAVWIPDCTLRLFACECREDADGERRVLTVSATVDFRADAYTASECDVLEDAYAPGYRLAYESRTLSTCVNVGELSSQFVLKDVAALPESAPDIREIVNVTGSIGTVDTVCGDGTVTLNGFVICKVLYLCMDDGLPMSSFTLRLPFTQSIDDRRVQEGMLPRLRTELNHISFSILSHRELELRLSVTVRGVLDRLQETEMIAAVSEETPCDPDEDRAVLVLYVVQNGDTLWKIGKRYGVSPDTLADVNHLKNPDLLLPGQKLLVVR